MSELITEIDIRDEAKNNFLSYASEVLTDRAIPSAEDGLLSAQRKILWTMEDHLKMTSKSKRTKSNGIVGSTLRTSYFHGDVACYGVLCKMAQSYLMRYPLIDGQGNFGSQEENGAEASSRYTEAKPSIYADMMMEQFKKDVVPTKETYNQLYYEPVVLPSLFPNAICNGRQTIGLSMSHNSLPHNLSEVCDAINKYIENGNTITIEELLSLMPGPDFPLPNMIVNSEDIRTAYMTGHSRISLKVRGEYEVDGNKIIFTSIPYRTYRSKIKEQLADNADELENYIEDFSDGSCLGNNKLIFTMKKGKTVEQIVNKLFATTDLQSTVSYNMNYIVDGTPKMCSMIDLIKAYVNHQNNVEINAATYDRNKAEARVHVLEGFLKILIDLDKAITIIRNSNDDKEAAISLIKTFGVDEIQAKAILDIKLSKLTKLGKKEIEEELQTKTALVTECKKIIEDSEYRGKIIIGKVSSMKAKYGDKRRTTLTNLTIESEEKEIEKIIPEDVVLTITNNGKIKRVSTKNFKTQRRNGVGIKNKEDSILDIISTNTTDNLLLFTNKGKMFSILVDKIIDGANLYTLINLEYGEKIIASTSLSNKNNPRSYVIFFTRNGKVKKTVLEEYNLKRVASKGTTAIKLSEGDSLANVSFVDDTEQIMLITKNGMVIRFFSQEISPTGKNTMGVIGIKLDKGDYVIAGLPFCDLSLNLAIFLKEGYGKQVPLSEFAIQARGGKGKKGIVSGEVVNALLINKNSKVLIKGNKTSLCCSSEEIPTLGRYAIGNTMIKDQEIQYVITI